MATDGLPRVMRITQKLVSEPLADVAGAVARTLGDLDLASSVRPGQTVSVACSSRGITDHALIVGSTVRHLRDLGLDPFIVPAMGSHGAGDAAGQARVLAHMGISEAELGVPVRSSLDVVRVGVTVDGLPVVVDRHAMEADHIVVVNRVKKHTEFVNDSFESGLQKMMAIGLGKQRGASAYHDAMFRLGYARVIRTVAEVVMRETPLLFGLGIVEDGRGQTARVRASRPAGLPSVEAELFAVACRMAASLPFSDIDVLVLEEIGKDISGTGLDTKVVGRIGLPMLSQEPPEPRVKRIVACDLTADSMGNAIGVGIVDFVTRRLVDKIDFEALNVNALTGVTPEMARIPMVLGNDRDAIVAAIKCVGSPPPAEVRLVRIRNTSALEELEVSEAFSAEISGRDDLVASARPAPLELDADGDLRPFAALTTVDCGLYYDGD
jgi:hypothetical protein